MIVAIILISVLLVGAFMVSYDKSSETGGKQVIDGAMGVAIGIFILILIVGMATCSGGNSEAMLDFDGRGTR